MSDWKAKNEWKYLVSNSGTKIFKRKKEYD